MDIVKYTDFMHVYKSKISTILVMLCLFFAGFNLYGVKQDLNKIIYDINYNQFDEINQVNNYYGRVNIYTKLSIDDKILIVYESLYKVINIILYLFVGGLIYGNNRTTIEK